MRYAIVIEKAEKNFAAYVPDLPGCVATGKSESHRAACMVSCCRASTRSPVTPDDNRMRQLNVS